MYWILASHLRLRIKGCYKHPLHIEAMFIFPWSRVGEHSQHLESVSANAVASDYLHQLFISWALITDHSGWRNLEWNGLNMAAGRVQLSSCLLPSKAVSPHLSQFHSELNNQTYKHLTQPHMQPCAGPAGAHSISLSVSLSAWEKVFSRSLCKRPTEHD